MAKKSALVLQAAFFDELKRNGLPLPEAEYHFNPDIKAQHYTGKVCQPWRFDYAWPEHRVAVEVQGGIWRKKGGAHTSPLNRLRDIEKNNAAIYEGWRVVQLTTDSSITNTSRWKGATLHLYGSYAMQVLKRLLT